MSTTRTTQSRAGLLALLLTLGCGGDPDTEAAGAGGAVGVGGAPPANAPANTIEATLNGEPLTWTITNAVVNNVEGLREDAIYTSFSGQGAGTLMLTFAGDAPGHRDCGGDTHTRVQFSKVMGVDVVTGDTEAQADATCAFEVTEVGDSGGVIVGTFSATLTDLSGGPLVFTNGAFDVSVP